MNVENEQNRFVSVQTYTQMPQDFFGEDTKAPSISALSSGTSYIYLPCPVVQPLPNRVPNPTRKPAMAYPSGDIAGVTPGK